jgi:hypothetical protein
MPEEEASSEGSSCLNKKANDPRKHHYVPVFYQRNFVNEKGLLWVCESCAYGPLNAIAGHSARENFPIGHRNEFPEWSMSVMIFR